MKPSHIGLSLLVALFLLVPVEGGCLNSREIIRLKKAGLEDETIQVLIQEKSIETGAFSVDDILELKKAGLKDTTIRLFIRENSHLRGREPRIYGSEIQSLTFTTVNDIIRLREAGISDEVIEAILLVIRDGNRGDQQRAWQMLESMGIRIDLRDE